MYLPGGPTAGISIRLTPEALPLVQVTGEGRLEVAPDTAEVSLGVSVRADSAAAAFDQAAAVLRRIVAVLLDLGIPQEQIQTDQILLFPIHDRERLVGYEATAILRVTLRDLALVGIAIDRAVAAGATRVQSIRFFVKDPSAFDALTLSAAVQDAQRRAALLARSLGVRLGPVWRVQAEPAPGPIFPAVARAVAVEAIPVLPGTMTLTRSVQVEFLIHHI